MSQIGEIKKLSDTRFLNFYEFEAVHRDSSREVCPDFGGISLLF